MQKLNELRCIGLRRKQRILFCALLTLFVVDALVLSGCSRTSQVERVETTETNSGDPSSRSSYRYEEQKTVQTEKSSSAECSGVLSCAVDTIGSIIAFPFKAVGALVGAIF